MNYREYFDGEIRDMVVYLRNEDIDEKIINDMVDSGYVCYNDMIFDTFYGFNLYNTRTIGINEIKYYQQNRKWESFYPRQKKIYIVNDIDEIYSIVDRLNIGNDKILFRGATSIYMFRRAFPSPVYSDKNGNEISMVPSYFRKYSNNYMERRDLEEFCRFLNSFFENLYYEKFYKLVNSYKNNEISFEKYCDEAEDFKEELDKDTLDFIDLSTIVQHYSYESNVLDVTYNIEIALFFALNKLVSVVKNYYDYIPLEKKEYKNAVIYILSPQTVLNDVNQWKYNYFTIKNLDCVRPIRQECTSLPANIDNINIAASEIRAIIKFSENFKLPVIMPQKEYLFPSAKEDPFYAYLLNNNKIKKKVMRFKFHDG